MTMRTVLVSGATHGLGAAFVQAYVRQPDTQVIAVDVLPFQHEHERCRYVCVDVSSESSIQDFSRWLHTHVERIDLVIHSAGVRGLVPSVENNHPADLARCETLEVMDLATLNSAFAINAAGAFMFIRALLPLLERGRQSKVIVMSSRMGSLSNNERSRDSAGGAYAYRASKAALNSLIRSFAVDMPSVCFVLCHPGRVETNLVRCKEQGAISAEESVTGLLPLIESWSLEDSGIFVDRFGVTIPW